MKYTVEVHGIEDSRTTFDNDKEGLAFVNAIIIRAVEGRIPTQIDVWDENWKYTDGITVKTDGPSRSEGRTKMTETAYEVKIYTWNLVKDSEVLGVEHTDFREFFDKDEAYRYAELWTNTFEKYIREGKRIKYRIEVTHIERNTYRYSGGSC